MDRLGVALPTALGAAACVAGVVLLSDFGVGGYAWVTGALVLVVAAGTTPATVATATGVSLVAPEENLPSGISVNDMVYIFGTSVGTALFSVAAKSGANLPLNPLHEGAGVGYSDAFLILSVPLILLLPTATEPRGAGKKRSG